MGLRTRTSKKTLAFYKRHFNIKPPYRVLVDGTFAKTAVTMQVNIREQMPKFLHAPCELMTTNCILEELKVIGDPVYAALHVLKQYHVTKCPHAKAKSATKCLKQMANRMFAEDHRRKYIICTQDKDLQAKLHTVPGVPVVFLDKQKINFDPISELSLKTVAFDEEAQIAKLKELRKDILGEREVKHRKPKGAHPLSCKKKKTGPAGGKANKKTEDEAEKKKRRHKKKNAQAGAAGASEGDSASAPAAMDTSAPTEAEA